MKYLIVKFCIILSALSFALQSCELQSEVYDSINPTLFPKTAADAKALVIGNAYGGFRNDVDGFFNHANGYVIVSEIVSDIGHCNWADRHVLVFNRWTDAASYFSNCWQYTKWLSKATLTIDRIEGIDIPDEQKQRFIAELRCARGWMAFLLYDLYGPIPIADMETLKNPLEEKILPRMSEEEMQQYIVTELTEAAKALPYNFKKGDVDYGRFTKGLCNTVLMKFYMMNKQWDKAEEYGRELMKPEYGYALMPKSRDVFTAANEKNVETIWATNNLPGYQMNYWMPHVLPRDFSTAPYNLSKWGGYRVTWDFFHTFEEGDTRREGIIYEYMGESGVLHNEENDVPKMDVLRLGPSPLKYEIDVTSTGETSQIDWIIYRYADVLTLLSEAIVRRGNAVTQEAVDLLNRVRTRAELPAYTMSSFSGTRDFLDKLMMERAHEFYFEGCRRQDIIRDGTYVELIKRKSQILGEPTLVNENYQRLPLPQSVINEGQGVIKQNPGY